MYMNSKIQSNTHKSIKYLLSTEYKYDPSYCIGILNVYSDIIMSELSCMQKLFGNSGNLILTYRTLLQTYNNLEHTIMYDYEADKGCKMSQLLERIWCIAKHRSEDDKRSIISNLFIQMQDGEKICFVGKFTRVVSTLVSFDPNIKLEISFPVRFANAVDYMKFKNTYTKENLIRFVQDSELESKEKQTWIDNIHEMFDD